MRGRPLMTSATPLEKAVMKARGITEAVILLTVGAQKVSDQIHVVGDAAGDAENIFCPPRRPELDRDPGRLSRRQC